VLSLCLVVRSQTYPELGQGNKKLMVNIGFIGVGGMGRYQAASFAQVRGARIVAAADLSAPSRKAFADMVPGAALYEQPRDLLADGKVDAVVVAVPTYYHAPVAIAALRSGRAVLVEKPMARTVADARRMNDVAAKTKQLLMVAHCRRYDADWGTFGNLVTSGKLGSPILWRSAMAGHSPAVPWFTDGKLSGGPLMDGAVHDQDFANMIFGDPQDIFASGVKLTESTCVDTATAIIRYRGGNQLMLSWSWGTAPGGGLHDALGTKASVIFNPADLNGDGIDQKKYGYYRLNDRRTRKSRLVRFTRKDMYVTQARHFIDCVDGRAKCRTPGTEAIKAVATAEAILKVAPKGGMKKLTW
jgi:predicted dehydrogenase